MRIPSKILQLIFLNKSEINKYFQKKISLFYKKYSDYDFLIIQNLNNLNFRKNFILSAMNLAFLGSYIKGEVHKSKYLIHWADGLFAKKICDINKKVSGRELIKSLKIPKIIKKIVVIGNLSKNSKLFLKKLYKKKIENIQLPYGDIKFILKKFRYRTSKNELIFLTLPTPKQEMIANYLASKNKKFKIICIGGSISLASGDELEVPKFINLFEFLWRLHTDTRRRIYRLLTTFLYFIIGKFFTKKINTLKIIYDN